MNTTRLANGSLFARAERALVLVVAGLLAVFLVANCIALGLQPLKWDVLLISGWITFLVGLIAVQSVPRRFEAVVSRLIRRGVLDAGEGPALGTAMEARAHRWGLAGAAAAGLFILGAFVMAFGASITFDGALLACAEFLGGLIAGYYLGRMVGYGSLWNLLNRRGVSIRPIPGHVDGAAGLKPIGDFYFYQASVASLPAVFTALWLLLFPLFAVPKDPLLSQYQHWREPYQMLLGLGILFEMGAFVLPMLGFHRLMVNAREACLHQADAIARELSQLEGRLATEETMSSTDAKALSERRVLLTQQYETLENMPTWPINRTTRKRFGMRNTLLALPLLFEMAGTQPTGAIKSLLDVAQKLQ